MTRSEIEDLIRTSYAARQREDVEGVMAFFSEDATFRISANERLGPLAVSLKGHDQLRACWIEQFAIWDWHDFPVISVLIDEGQSPVQAAVRCQGEIVHTPSGHRFPFETLDILTVENGKITDFMEFFDTDLAVQVQSMGAS